MHLLRLLLIALACVWGGATEPGCVDKNLECSEWADEGQCALNTAHGEWLRTVACPLSCGRCRWWEGAPAGLGSVGVLIGD